MNLKSYLLAASLLLLLSVWMFTGLFGQDQEPDDTADQARAEPMSVQVQELVSEQVSRELEVQGQTEAEADIQLRAEVAGRVTAVQGAEGDEVTTDELLVEIAMGNRASLQTEAEARVMQREADFLAAERLGDEGFQSEIAVAQARAELAAARAQLDSIEEQIRHTQIRAPIDGYLETLPVSVGDYVSVGDPVARLIDADPLIITANIAQ
ncbi:MAG: efflux RND transporter periplasmic adaptor subunit, partial [Gammaproteobacteria bacterium]|nr:efflux RND transporter periplasmic adaptor subunit [Gammaproteobacteria bacterium]